ncbi:cell wall hydrolase [Pacificibacter marinus]|uniref:Spore cortex-lytic enzyme n=1 Tax=Pacificibacter marinus TaxID=658057 RepID=A0A1Y5SPY4_9RHOB|nr:cell wall hydrolase [Pacificibacter marinus]SEK69118.1 Cell wall hydrolase CwlJ, involved in spore germination [Pacificibacter marinus]SLN45681.1 Spore cortex-lytic enzyme precursor [Pacificibacter marinus]
MTLKTAIKTTVKTAAVGAFLGAFSVPLVAQADVTLSTSNDPNFVLGAQVTELLTHERESLRALETDTVAQMLASFKPVPKPQPPVKVDYTRDFLADVSAASGGENWECLTQALYFEARGESVKGQFAVAEVILNRVSSPKFPNSVCAVVTQGTGKKFRCQFTYTCDGRAEVITEKAAWRRLGKIARLMMDGAPRRLTEGATHYHTKAVNPRWARAFPRTASIGVHYFYRMPRA